MNGQMPIPRHVLLFVLGVAALGLSLAGGGGILGREAAAPGAVAHRVAAQPLRFDPAVSAADRRVVVGAIAAARPEARALVGRVDGLVTIAVGPTGVGAVGLTEGNPRDGYRVTLDLAAVAGRSGARGISRLVLHELGHVVDHVLLSPEQQRDLDAGIPPGYACPPGEATGACAARDERFAETFAKWASGDIGINVSLGYKVPPPPSLDAWGAGLPSPG
jgi:hypothetical protein